MTDDTLYDDGLVKLDARGITLRQYYFPFGTAKHIRYDQVRGIESRPMGALTGQWRLWGTSSPRYWMPLDLRRTRKHQMLILDLGQSVKPAFTPDDPERVMQLIEQHLAGR